MILDDLSRASHYTGLAPRLVSALEWLKTANFDALRPGRNEIDGCLYAMRLEYQPGPLEKAVWEAHRTHADVQYIVEGEELCGYSPLPRMTLAKQLDEENALYTGDGSLFHLRAGQFVILLPGEVHMPGVQTGENPGKVKKFVVKVPLF